MFENRPEPVLTGFGPVRVNFGKFWTGYGSGSPQKGKKTGPDRTSKHYPDRPVDSLLKSE
jgi:hypothetical protein